MLKSINDGIIKTNKKKYKDLKSEKEKLENAKQKKEKELLEKRKIKVNAMKKSTDDKTEKESINERNVDNKEMTAEQKKSYLVSKDLIAQYKTYCEDLEKQEKLYMEKISEAKKVMNKKRSDSAGNIKVSLPKTKIHNLNKKRNIRKNT